MYFDRWDILSTENCLFIPNYCDAICISVYNSASLSDFSQARATRVNRKFVDLIQFCSLFVPLEVRGLVIVFSLQDPGLVVSFDDGLRNVPLVIVIPRDIDLFYTTRPFLLIVPLETALVPKVRFPGSNHILY